MPRIPLFSMVLTGATALALRPLAVSAQELATDLPDIPANPETGPELPDFPTPVTNTAWH